VIWWRQQLSLCFGAVLGQVSGVLLGLKMRIALLSPESTRTHVPISQPKRSKYNDEIHALIRLHKPRTILSSRCVWVQVQVWDCTGPLGLITCDAIWSFVEAVNGCTGRVASIAAVAGTSVEVEGDG